jgi:hypothetical protein
MHICPDEIVPAIGVLGLIPFCCRWCWNRARSLFRNK